MTRFGLAIGLLLSLAACAAHAPEASQVARSSSVSAVVPSPSAAGHVLATEVDEELRAELLAMQVEDQAVRTGVAPPGDDRTAEELFAAWDAVDAANAVRMEEILDEYGWPGWSLVGEDGAFAAWLMIQHADLRPELQKRGLAMLEAAVAAEDADPGDLAYLVDRVLVAEGKPQVYGTQVATEEDGTIIPRTPIEDPDNVDARRAEMGLGTLEEYYEELRETFEELPAESP
jgi:hypothetical protein